MSLTENISSDEEEVTLEASAISVNLENDLTQREQNSEDQGFKTPAVQKKKSFKYKHRDDINLLLEVITEKPVGKNSGNKWQTIYERLNLPVPDSRSLRNRFKLLLDAHKQKTLRSLRASGTEEDYDEKERLLTDICDQMDDWKQDEEKASETEKRKLQDEKVKAQKIRQASMETMSTTAQGDENVVTPTSDYGIKKRRKIEVIDLIEAKDKTEAEVAKRRLDLDERELGLREINDQHRREMERRQLELEERRLKLDEQKMQHEHEEKSMLYKLLGEKNLK